MTDKNRENKNRENKKMYEKLLIIGLGAFFYCNPSFLSTLEGFNHTGLSSQTFIIFIVAFFVLKGAVNILYPMPAHCER